MAFYAETATWPTQMADISIIFNTRDIVMGSLAICPVVQEIIIFALLQAGLYSLTTTVLILRRIPKILFRWPAVLVRYYDKVKLYYIAVRRVVILLGKAGVVRDVSLPEMHMYTYLPEVRMLGTLCLARYEHELESINIVRLVVKNYAEVYAYICEAIELLEEFCEWLNM